MKPSCRNSSCGNRRVLLPIVLGASLFVSVPAIATAMTPEKDTAVSPAVTLPPDTVVTLPAPPATPLTITIGGDPLRSKSTEANQEGQNPAESARSFLSTLVHNLGDDVKHLPRVNSLYWAAGGGAAALAVHPLDASLNQHLLGSTAWDSSSSRERLSDRRRRKSPPVCSRTASAARVIRTRSVISAWI